MSVDLIVCKILSDYLDITADRIVLYNNNWNLPTDSGSWVLVSLGTNTILGSNFFFDDTTDEEVTQVIQSQEIYIDIVSRDASAKTYSPQIQAALKSYISEQYQAENDIKISRGRQVLDLSAVEGASALHRYRHSAIVNHIDSYRRSIDYFDKFSTEEINSK